MAENKDYSNINPTNIQAVRGEDLDNTKVYLNEIGSFPLLSHEEEMELARKIKEGTEEESKKARKELINSNLRLVVFIAKHYASRLNEPLLEVIQNGNLGLLKAVEMYDYTLGYKFSTYAVGWIRQAITRAYADTNRTIRLPVCLQAKQVELKKTRAKFMVDNNREPTIEELENITGFSKETIKEVELIFQDIVSLNMPISEDEDSVLMDVIADNSRDAKSDIAVENIISDELWNVFYKILNDREIVVIKRRFGFEKGEPETLEEIAKSVGLTRERIRQIEGKALRKMKKYLKAHYKYDDLNN